MQFAPGTAIGPYEIVAPIGAGGMGEVYRARDSRLQRDVAIKVLPASFADDPDRRARFEREAQAIAALSHPNILAVYDTGVHAGQLFVVTELLEGETLADRLKNGALPVRKALDIAVQVARGLAAAHDKHLVHRDLKPENLFLIRDGHVKILDFGLARHASSATGASETLRVVTDPGMTMGTVGYMAPEQVRGQAVDGRADLFAFGTVIYEMLTGQRAFRRDTPMETMAAILRDEPPDAPLTHANLSPALDRIIRHCLEKDPAERFQSARDVAFALESLSGTGPTAAQHDGARTRRAAWRGPVLVGLIAAVIAAVAWSLWRGRSEGGSDVGAVLAIGTATQATADPGLEVDPVLSPDGKLLAYSAGRAAQMRIFIRPVSGGRTIALSEGTSAFEYQPRFSPDGSQILYLTPAGAFIASALGGTSTRVSSGLMRAATWAPDGRRLAIARGDEIAILSLDGGAARPIGKADELHSCAWAATRPWIACTSGNPGAVVPGGPFGNIAPSQIVLVPANGGPIVQVTDRLALNDSPAWSADDRELLFVSNRNGPSDIYSARIGDDGRVVGNPIRVTTGLGVRSIALSADGRRIAYETYVARSNLWTLPIPARGPVDTSGATQLTSENQMIESANVSRDQRWLFFDSDRYQTADIFRIPVGGDTSERLTFDPADEFAPDLSPNGREVAYHLFRSGTRDIFIKPLDGGPVQQVTSSPAQESYPIWSPDGLSIVFLDQFVENGVNRGLFMLRRDDAGRWSAPVPVPRSAGARRSASWIPPDSHAIVYSTSGSVEVLDVSTRDARNVYRPASASDPRAESVKVSPDGLLIYFKSHDAEQRASIWSVPVAGGKPSLVVRFSDPLRESIRADFAVGAGRFFFTLEDRQADIWVADAVQTRGGRR